MPHHREAEHHTEHGAVEAAGGAPDVGRLGDEPLGLLDVSMVQRELCAPQRDVPGVQRVADDGGASRERARVLFDAGEVALFETRNVAQSSPEELERPVARCLRECHDLGRLDRATRHVSRAGNGVAMGSERRRQDSGLAAVARERDGGLCELTSTRVGRHE